MVIEFLKITGILGLIGRFAGPVMALWGLMYFFSSPKRHGEHHDYSEKS